MRMRLLACLGVGVFVLPSTAVDPVQLTQGSSGVWIDPGTQAGVYDWIVSGQDHLEKQWWWVQVGGQRVSVDQLGALVVTPISANKVLTTYTDALNQFSIQISYELTGSDFASGQSLLKESVSILNNSGSALNLSLFMFSDFDLGGTAPAEGVSLLGMNDSVFPFGSTVGWFEARQSEVGNSHAAIFNGKPLLGELGDSSVILNKLNATINPLASSAGMVLSPTVGATALSTFGPVTPADAAYAIQWDFNIAGGGTAGVGVDKRLVVTPIPEPGSVALSLLGVTALLRFTVRRKV